MKTVRIKTREANILDNSLEKGLESKATGEMFDPSDQAA
jgi:hypothetical protein